MTSDLNRSHGKMFRIKKVSNDFKIYRKTLMKILYLKGDKWSLSQNERVRNDVFGHRRY